MSQYSNTLRKRVLEEVDQKVARELVANKFSIHINTINNWLRLRKKGLGQPTPDLNNWKTKARPDRGSKVLNLEKLKEFVLKYPDMYLEEIAKEFNSNDSTVSYWVLKMGLDRKKNKKFTRKEMKLKD